MEENINLGLVRMFLSIVSSSQSFVTLHLPLPVISSFLPHISECSMIVTLCASVKKPPQKSPDAPPPIIITSIFTSLKNSYYSRELLLRNTFPFIQYCITISQKLQLLLHMAAKSKMFIFIAEQLRIMVKLNISEIKLKSP